MVLLLFLLLLLRFQEIAQFLKRWTKGVKLCCFLQLFRVESKSERRKFRLILFDKHFCHFRRPHGAACALSRLVCWLVLCQDIRQLKNRLTRLICLMKIYGLLLRIYCWLDKGYCNTSRWDDSLKPIIKVSHALLVCCCRWYVCSSRSNGYSILSGR